MIEVTGSIRLDESELVFEFVRSSGPGGQNVNKVATAVRLRFDVRRSASLPDDVRARLLALAGRRASEDGVLTIRAERHRTQQANRRDAVERLVELVRRAAAPPKKRRATRPSAASRERRLESKRRLSRRKGDRGRPEPDSD
ncbi:MAG: aminoacyl-tRNA hydrolase [Candidatus Latescibacterota bacterium]|nr:MAG: aminoacyl-tRNA hydrolase [Candidatus Latescibacterota bacterium]